MAPGSDWVSWKTKVRKEEKKKLKERRRRKKELRKDGKEQTTQNKFEN